MSNRGERPCTRSQVASIPVEVSVSTLDSLEECSSNLWPRMAEMRGILDEGGRYPSY